MALPIVLAVSAGILHASATPAQKCAVAKNKAAAKKVLGKLKCWQKAIAAGLPAADSSCLSAAEAKFHDAITKAEFSGSCAVTGDETSIEDAVNACVASIVSLTPATTTTTSAASSTTTMTATSTTTTTTACAYTAFTPVAQDAVDALGLDAAGDLNVPASCSGSPTVCCPGGTPLSPCGPLQFDFVAQPGDAPTEVISSADGCTCSNRYNVTLRARVKTISDLPVNVFGTDCNLHIDSTAGSNQQVQFDFQVMFSCDHIRMGPVGTVAVSGTEAADFSLSGGVGCQGFNPGTSFYNSVLQETISQNLSFAALCRCGSDLVSCGP